VRQNCGEASSLLQLGRHKLDERAPPLLALLEGGLALAARLGLGRGPLQHLPPLTLMLADASSGPPSILCSTSCPD
jgi:hypothetical protein